MSFEKCYTEIRDAVTDLMNDKEAKELLGRIKSKIDEKKSAKEIEANDDIIVDEIAEDNLKQNLIEKLNKFRDRELVLESYNSIKELYPNDPDAGIRALLGGLEDYRKGARLSVDNYQLDYKNKYMGGFTSEVEELGLVDFAKTKEVQRDVYIELFDNPFFRDGKGPETSISLNDNAFKLAKIVKKYNDMVLDDKNALGAWISRLPGYVLRQNHFPDNMLRAAGNEVKDEASHKTAWISYIKDRLDADRTFKGEDPDKFLSVTWDNIIEGKNILTLDSSSQFGTRNIAKRLSAERVLHFKSGRDFFEYDQRFGSGDLMEGLLHGFYKAGQDLGLMKGLGTNPKANLQKIIDLLNQTYTGKKAAKLNFSKFENLYKELDGSINLGAENSLPKVLAAVRTIGETGKLTGISITSLADFAGMMAETVNYQGMNMFETFSSLLKESTRGKTPDEIKKILGPFNLFTDLFTTYVNEHHAFREELTGKLASYRAGFYKFVGFTGLMRRFKSAMIVTMQNYYGNLSKNPFNKLDDQTKLVLGLYGIDQDIWNIMRKTTLKKIEGYDLLTVDNIKEISDADANAYLLKTKPQYKKFSKRQIENFKKDVQSKWRMFLYDRTHHGVLEPGARERAWLNQGFEKGTAMGQILRMMTQFKSFATTLFNRQIIKNIKGYGPGLNMSKTIPSLASYSVMMTMLGYMVLSMKDVLNGKEPRDPLNPKTALASFMQGGGGGIYFDILYSEISRSNGGAASTILGPTFADIEAVFKTLKNVGTGKLDKAGVRLINLLEANTPVDIWFLKPAYEYLIGYQLKEALDPGYFRRLEGYYLNNTGQEFFLKP